jgi:hypothetical protein
MSGLFLLSSDKGTKLPMAPSAKFPMGITGAPPSWKTGWAQSGHRWQTLAKGHRMAFPVFFAMRKPDAECAGGCLSQYATFTGAYTAESPI